MKYNKKMTCTTLFLRPTLEIKTRDLEANNFINAYLDDISHDIHYEDCIYLLFKPHDFDKFQYFLSRERSRISIVEDYDYEEYVVVVYNIPEKFKKDYQLFLEGKYSEFSKDIREVIGNNISPECIQLKVITKSPELKEHWEKEFGVEMDQDQEVWEKPDLSREVLDIDEIRRVK